MSRNLHGIRSGSRRIESLATLPLFATLEGKRTVVVGGTNAAFWKAELLVAAGAHVDVYAPGLDDDFRAWISSDSAQVPCRVVWHPRAWVPADLSGASLAIADTEEDREAARFAEAARNHGAIYNVIDKPAFSAVQFGSIVNRSPIVIGISTNGAAPVIAQRIRARIEAHLPPFVAAWGALAKRLRHDVAQRIQSNNRRRHFWQRFAAPVFDRAPTDADAVDAFRHPLSSDGPDCDGALAHGSGHVSIVGAGPGDANLLTIKASEALRHADIILFDALVSDEVLALARREAKRMLVGKRAGSHHCEQEEINRLMIRLARAGRRVVRLKGGDPSVFGRLGEEVEQLRAAGISFDVVPGITTATAMAASLGVSLTHRDYAQSVQFVTGHRRSGELPDDIDWGALAHPRSTSVFYMGRRTATQIAQRLIAGGLDPSTPVAVCEGVSRPEASNWTGTLASVGPYCNALDTQQPVVIAVGEVLRAASSVAPGTELPPITASIAGSVP